MRMTARNQTGQFERQGAERGWRSFRVSAVLCAAAVLCAPLGAGAQTLTERLRACASEKNEARRLACYDRETARDGEGASAKSAETPAAPATVAGPAQPAEEARVEPAKEKFGYRGSIARKEIDERAAADPGVDRLEATVTELSTRPLGQLVLTLDNGQVWAQKTADSAPIKVGDRVVIKKASFGSFLLVAPNKRTTRVTREQ